MNFSWNECIEFAMKEGVVRVRQIREEDIEAVIPLYNETLIDIGNYRERFDAESSESFGKIGGMFSIYGSREVKEITEDKTNGFMLGAFEGDRPVGLVWSALSDDHFDDFSEKYREREGFPDFCREYEKMLAENSLLYGREIIVTPSAKNKGIAACLIYALVYCGNKFGFSHTTGEVYNVRGYDVGRGFVPVNLFNSRSFHVLKEQTGGENVCGFGLVVRKLNGFIVYYESEVIVWTWEKMKAACEMHFKSKNIEFDIKPI